MAQFILNDFISDRVPHCPLSNSKLVSQAYRSIMHVEGEIYDIRFVGLIYKKEILFEWNILIKSETTLTIIPIPFYIPAYSNEQEVLEKHTKAHHNPSTLVHNFSNNEYLLIDGKYPCQLIRDDAGVLHVKRIEYFASQKMIQDFLKSIYNFELVAAAMVVINFHTLCCKGLYDIGWLISMDGTLSCLSLDRRFTNLGFYIIDGYEEVNIGEKFNLNGQDYIVEENEDIGQFIAKIPHRRHR